MKRRGLSRQRNFRDKGGNPKIPFSATISKSKITTFTNLFYAQLCAKTKEKRVAKESKKVLQPICVAYKASSPVELPNAASHEMVDTPMFLFNSYKTIPTGQNSELMKMIKFTANVESTNS